MALRDIFLCTADATAAAKKYADLFGVPAQPCGDGEWRIALEHGYDQAAAVRELLATGGLRVAATRRDLAGIELHQVPRRVHAEELHEPGLIWGALKARASITRHKPGA